MASKNAITSVATRHTSLHQLLASEKRQLLCLTIYSLSIQKMLTAQSVKNTAVQTIKSCKNGPAIIRC